MTKQLKNLPRDIYALFNNRHKVTGSIDDFAKALAVRISSVLEKEETKPYLRPSNVGTPCARQLWYNIRKPELAEPMPPWTHIKFLFGHIIEETILFLAKEAGYEVKDEQRRINYRGVSGSIDATVESITVDVKSAASRSFEKFKQGLQPETDGFGYLKQLATYAFGNLPDQPDGDKPERVGAAFIAVDKQLGHITVDEHVLDDPADFIEERRRIVANDEIPERGFQDVPDGQSGNRKLGVNCGYCAFKRSCWPGLRTFLYARGPVHLTKVVRVPDVQEA